MTDRIIDFPLPERRTVADNLLQMLVEQGHMDASAVPGKSIFSVVLEDWQIDLLSCYGITDAERDDANLEDNDNDEYEVPT